MRHLTDFIDLPCVTTRGRLIVRPGYDTQTGLYMNVPVHYQSAVRAFSTREDVAAALRVICTPWAEYKFVTPDDAAGLLSGVFASVLRPALQLIPAFLIDAPAQAAGKTKMARSLGAVVEGRLPAVTPFAGSSDDDELRKRLMAGAIDGVRFHCIDNVVGHLKSSTLAAVLTSGRLSDRILGKSSTVDVAVKSLLTMTSNNGSLDADLIRRTVQVRIDGGESASKRVFQFDPVSLALSMRLAIADAVCGIVLAYFNEGARSMTTTGTGGFDDWDRLCRQTVIWAVEQAGSVCPWNASGDPAATMLRDPSNDDPELEAMSDTLTALEELSQGYVFTSAEALGWYQNGQQYGLSNAASRFQSALNDLLARTSVTTRSIGNAFRFRRDRVVNGRKLIADDSGRVARWRVVSVTGA